MKKRMIASLLALIMVLSMFPTALAAEDFSPAEPVPPAQAVCTCSTPCTADAVQADCPVCSGEAGYLACTASPETPPETPAIPWTELTPAQETDVPDAELPEAEPAVDSIDWSELIPATDAVEFLADDPVVDETTLLAALADPAQALIKIQSDITLSKPVTIDRSVQIQGGGFVLSPDTANTSGLIIVAETGDLTLSDITLDGQGQCGSLLQTNAGNLTLSDAVIERGTSNIGAGILIGENTTATLTNVLIQNNTAQTSGGGMVIHSGAKVTMTDCRVTKNTIRTPSASNGAGIACGGELTMINGRIDHNTGAWYGGGLYVNPDGQADLQGAAVYENDVSGWDSQVDDSQGSDIYKTDGSDSTLKFNPPSEWTLNVIGAENWYLDYASKRYPGYHEAVSTTEYHGGDAFVGTVGTVHTVTFDADGGTFSDGNSSQDILVWEDETVSPSRYFELTEQHVPKNPTRKGYKFFGWYDEQNQLLDPYEPVTADKTYTARWVADTKNVLYFVTNGGSPVAPVAVEPNTDIDLTPYVTTREGLVFAGWYSDQALTGPALTSIRMDQDHTVYAAWTNGTVHVTYNPNGGQWSDGSSSDAKTVAIPTGTTAENLKNLTLEGKRLEGWSTSPNGTPLFDFATPIHQSITLYAVWKDADMVTVTFDGNGGYWHHTYHYFKSGSKPYADSKPGDKIKDLYGWPDYDPSVTHFDRENYYHLGWSTDPNAASPEFNADHEFIVPDHDVTYYAVWRTARGTIWFRGESSTSYFDPPVRGYMDPMRDVAYDTDLTLTPNSFTQWGHEFSHWSTKSDNPTYDNPTYKDQAPAKGLITKEGMDLTLTATFNPAMMDVTYDLEGVTIDENPLGDKIRFGYYLDGSKIYISANPGFVLGRWNNFPRVNIYYTDEQGKQHQIRTEYKYDTTKKQSYIKLGDDRVGGPVTVQIKAEPIRYTVTFQSSSGSKPDWIWDPRHQKYDGEITYMVPHGKSLNDLKEEMIKVGNLPFPTLDSGKWTNSQTQETTLEEIWNKKFYAKETYTLKTEKSSQTAVRFYLEGGTTTAESDGGSSAPYILIDPPKTGAKKLSEYDAYQKFTSIAPEKADSEFGGWFKSKNPSSNEDNAGSIEITSDQAGQFVNVYAYWGSSCKIVFHSNGGTGGPENFSIPLKKNQTTLDIKYDVWDAIQNADDPLKEKHALIGWSYQKYTDNIPLFAATNMKYDSDVIIKSYSTYKISTDKSITVDIYAVWCSMDDMILRFDTHGGTPEYPEQHTASDAIFSTLKQNSDNPAQDLAATLAGLSIPENDPSREGYIFKSWYWNFEDFLLDGKENLLELQKSYAPESAEYGYLQNNISTLNYALAAIDQVRQGAIENATPGEDADEAIWNAFVKNNYIQIMDPTADSPFDPVIRLLSFYAQFTSQYNLTLHAKWIPDPNYVDVTFLSGEHGALSGKDTFRVEKDTTMQSKGYTVPSVAANKGYQFTGWADQNGNPYTNAEILQLSIANSMTFTAQYEAAPEIPDEPKSAAITFRVVHGAWADGSRSDQTIEIPLHANGQGTLPAAEIPSGMQPDPGYADGAWNPIPDTAENAIDRDMLYTYTFLKQQSPDEGEDGGHGGGGGVYYTLHYVSNGGTPYRDERYRKNTVVTLDKLPTRQGYTFTGWYADEDLTDRITQVKMTRDKTVYAGWEPTGVPDWLNGADHFAYAIGYADGTVRPLHNISRAEVATIFFRLLDSDIRTENLTADNPFADVWEEMWCNTAVSTMSRLGIIQGRSPERFDPNAPITRAEFAAICARFDHSNPSGSSHFTDLAGHWAAAEIEQAASLGWIHGYTDHTFRPDQPITRAEAMTMINRVLNRLPGDAEDLLDGMRVWPDNPPDAWYYLAVQEATNSHSFTRKGDVYERWTSLTTDPDWSRYL